MIMALTGIQIGPRQLELPPNIPVFGFGRQIVHAVLLSSGVEGVGMLLVKFGKRPDAVGAEKFILVEHLRENTAQPLSLTSAKMPRSAIPKWPAPGRMNGLQKFRHPEDTLLKHGCGLGNPFSLPRFNHGGRAERKEADHGANLELGGAPSGSRNRS